MHDLGSSGFASENLITTANASALRSATGWPVKGGGAITTQPVVANNLVYWGTWDGYEHATPLPGSVASGWATNLGQTSACGSATGVASTGAVASVTLPGQTSPRSVLFVGGGGNNTAGGGYAQLYALDALTGSVLWHTPLGLSPNNFIWSSPAVYTYTNSSGATVTSVYVGVASYGDCPLVQGQVVQLDATSGQIQNTFDVVPSGCTGGGVWGSPTIDQSDGSLYVATGNSGSCSSPQPYGEALVKLRASDLSVLDHWQIPTAEKTEDGDFGAAPTLFTGTVTPGGTVRSLVGVPDKNGIYYVFDRSQVSAGPVARPQVAVGGGGPLNGEGSISPSAWDGTTLYVAGGKTTINGTSYPGSVRGFNPNNLSAPLWQHGLSDGFVLGAVTAAPGLVVVGEGHYIVVVDASNGNVLLRAPSISGASFYGAASIAYGTLFDGDTAGYLYAYTVPPTVTFVSPTSGPAVGGTSVTITGTDFSKVSAVKFGSANATSFTVNSPTSIAAISPAGSGTVDVTVTTPGGTSATGSADQFHYLPPAPTVKTEAASSVTQTSATLHATVNPNGFQVTECKFEYGPTEAYGSSAPCTPPPPLSGESPIVVSAALESLAENTEYHFRISATSANGTSVGSDGTFTTLLVLGPHWYKNGVKLVAGKGLPVLTWGTLTLMNSSVGALECQTAGGGQLENPSGGGAGKGSIQGFIAYGCVAPACEAVAGTPVLVPEKRPWSAVAIEETPLFRDKLEGIALQALCAAAKQNVLFHGSLKPQFMNGSVQGARPSILEFGAGSGGLESSAGAGEVSGTMKLFGFSEGQIIALRNP